MGNKDGLSAADKAILKEWKEKIKADWGYKQKLVIYEGENGIITPTTTTTTTTTTTPKPPVTTAPSGVNSTTGSGALTTFSSIVINVTTAILPTPKEGELQAADTSRVIKIVGGTVGILLFLVFLAFVTMWTCRRTKRRERERVSVRRPLNPVAEEHIYAEIEPLQIARQESPSSGSGATGNSSIQLPRKKEKRVSSFRNISTRIYKWLNFNTDDEENHAVSYNRSDNIATVHEVPEPPERNVTNGRKNIVRPRPRPGARLPSVAKPLIDIDVERRDHVYNPLQARAESGPYDALRLSRRGPGENDLEPSSPHDYFVLEKDSSKQSPFITSESGKTDTDDNSKAGTSAVLQSVTEINEEAPGEETRAHDYFILAQTPAAKGEGTSSPVDKVNSDSSASKGGHSESPIKDKSSTSSCSPTSSTATKPAIKPRAISNPKQDGNATSPTDSSGKVSADSSDSSKDRTAAPGNDYTVLEAMETAPSMPEAVEKENKDEDYVISKMGAPPVPPAVEDDYLLPVEKLTSTDYLDVMPTPPPRTSSVQVPESGQPSVVVEVRGTQGGNANTEEDKKAKGVPLNKATESEV